MAGYDRLMAALASYPDPRLSRFEPLERVFYFDDFDEGYNGWTELIGNYEHSLDAMLPAYQDMRPPQLSTAPMWDTGSHGSLDGAYSLKIATRPRAGHQAVVIKRATYRQASLLRVEAYFTFKPEATELRLGDQDVRAIGVLMDLQNDDERVMPHLRYLNSLEGTPQQLWQYKAERAPIEPIGTDGKTVSHYHLSPDGWQDIPDGAQQLCYNEIATKLNWHYLRLDFDLASMAYVGFRCNDHLMDVAKLAPMRMPAMPNLWCMLNLVFFAEADTDKRVLFYLDSVLVSGQL